MSLRMLSIIMIPVAFYCFIATFALIGIMNRLTNISNALDIMNKSIDKDNANSDYSYTPNTTKDNNITF